MFEKEAIRHAFEDTIGIECLIKPVEDFTYEELSDEQQEKAYDFQNGAEFGYNKAKEWHEYSERPKEKINALCFDISQNKFILGFYDLEADEWLRYGGYETIYIDLWTKIEIPEFIKE